MPEYEGKVNAPEFPERMEWLNTDRPLAIRQLKGKVVLLDFWTFCCINCMHVIPDLKKLEHKYQNELVVIELPSQSIAPGDATLTLELELPAGYKLNAQAPSALTIAARQAVSLAGNADEIIRNPKFPISVSIKAAEGDAIVEIACMGGRPWPPLSRERRTPARRGAATEGRPYTIRNAMKKVNTL